MVRDDEDCGPIPDAGLIERLQDPADVRIIEGGRRVAGSRPRSVIVVSRIDVAQVYCQEARIRFRMIWHAASVRISSWTTSLPASNRASNPFRLSSSISRGVVKARAFGTSGKLSSIDVEPAVHGQLIAAEVCPAFLRTSNRRGTRTNSCWLADFEVLNHLPRSARLQSPSGEDPVTIGMTLRDHARAVGPGDRWVGDGRIPASAATPSFARPRITGSEA